MPAPDDMLTRRPRAPVFRSAGRAARVVSRGPMILVSNIGRYSSGDDGADEAEAGVVDENVEPAEGVRRQGHRLLGCAGLGHVERSRSRGLRMRLGDARERGRVARRSDDLIATIEGRSREQTAEARGTAGDKPSLGHERSRVGRVFVLLGQCGGRVALRRKPMPHRGAQVEIRELARIALSLECESSSFASPDATASSPEAGVAA